MSVGTLWHWYHTTVAVRRVLLICPKKNKQQITLLPLPTEAKRQRHCTSFQDTRAISPNQSFLSSSHKLTSDPSGLFVHTITVPVGRARDNESVLFKGPKKIGEIESYHLQ